MAIKFDGINPESKAKLEGIVSDGKVTAEEVKGLTEAEKEALSKALGGADLPDSGEIKFGEPEPKDDNKKSLGETVGTAAAIIAASTAIGGIIGGIAGFFGGAGAGAVPGAIGGAKIGAAIGTGLTLLLGLTGCSPDEPDVYIEGSTTNITNNINITAKNSNEEIIAKLDTMNATLETIVKYLIEIGCDFKRVIDILLEMGKGVDNITSTLTDGLSANTEAQEEIKSLLTTIVTLIQQGNELGEKNNALLNAILSKISSTNNDEEAIKLLKEILAKLTESVEQNKEMDDKTHLLLNAILNKMDKMDGSMKTAFSNIINLITEGNKVSEAILNKMLQILDKLDNMNTTNKAAFTAILNAIQNLGEGTDAKLEAILDAINNGNTVTTEQLEELRKLLIENNNIAQGTQDAVKDLKDKMSAEHQAILDKITQGNASLDEIKQLLVAIKGGVDANTLELAGVNEKLSLVGAVLNNILVNVSGIKDETKALLLQILAKIPNGCTCKTLDLSAVLGKLDEILEELRNDPNDEVDNNGDGNTNEHEGILKDLDDYFN